MWDMANDEVEPCDECNFNDDGICRECGEEKEES
tara:strand:+ start:327 stop:428 length:102 start_codon:yes stop_codon:yes gene_type:complete